MICNLDVLLNGTVLPSYSRSISLTAPCGPVAIPAHQKNKQNSMEKLDSKYLFCCKCSLRLRPSTVLCASGIHICIYMHICSMTRQKYIFGEPFHFDTHTSEHTRAIRANKQISFLFLELIFFSPPVTEKGWLWALKIVLLWLVLSHGLSYSLPCWEKVHGHFCIYIACRDIKNPLLVNMVLLPLLFEYGFSKQMCLNPNQTNAIEPKQGCVWLAFFHSLFVSALVELTERFVLKPACD